MSEKNKNVSRETLDESRFYNPKRLLDMKDLDGEEPCIYIITSNRSAGKTTAFLKKALVDYHNNDQWFMLVYRYNYELSSANEIFRDVLFLYPNLGTEMKAVPRARGLFYELTIDSEPCGFAVSLSNVDSLKKYSPLFSHVENIIMDEYQTESGKYLNHEVQKLESLLLTVSRGGGEQSRKVKVFLLGNFVTLLNPYFIRFGINKRVKKDTKFMRGKGWVAEFGFNVSASKAIKDNPIAKAFAGDKYIESSSENIYLHDSECFIEKVNGKMRYVCNIIYDNKMYGVREYYEKGIMHVSKKCDKSYPFTLAFKANDHSSNTIMLNHYSAMFKYLKDAFYSGAMRFQDAESKNAMLEILGIDLYS